MPYLNKRQMKILLKIIMIQKEDMTDYNILLNKKMVVKYFYSILLCYSKYNILNMIINQNN